MYDCTQSDGEVQDSMQSDSWPRSSSMAICLVNVHNIKSGIGSSAGVDHENKQIIINSDF